MQTLVIATANIGKVREFAALLDLPGVRIITAADAGVAAWPPETGETFAENAAAKARYALAQTGLPALADDSGLIVDALGGEPGVYSARYGGEGLTDRDRYALLLSRLVTATPAARTARFVASLAFVVPDGRLWHAEGRVEGTIADAGRGENGFGYDPVFVPAGETRTYAEMPASEKHALSHRARAVERIRPVVLRYFAEGAEGTDA